VYVSQRLPEIVHVEPLTALSRQQIPQDRQDRDQQHGEDGSAVVAFICSFAMFLQYMREDADDDGNSKRPAGVNRVRPVAEGQALVAPEAEEGPNMTVLIYVNTSKHVGDADHLKVFANTDAAERWLDENDPEGVVFEYEVLE
jgi:hypothetical protein